jgi:membrane associated rhomboid family serine protease
VVRKGEQVVRPKSVILGERVSLLAILLLVVLAAIGWSDTVAQAGVAIAVIANGLLIGLFALATLMTTRLGSLGGLIFLIVLTVMNLGGFLYQVSVGALAEGLFGVLTSVQAAASLVAAVLLARPNARAWYRAMSEVDEA